ncbi:amidohydrolase [Bacteroidota bacterium]
MIQKSLQEILPHLIKLRKQLHTYPELSGNESGTSKLIKEFIEPFHPFKVIKLGNTGLAFILDGEEVGPTIMFRADMDALPINEINRFSYKSKIKGVSHLCGHDGHIAILSGLAYILNKHPVKKGKVVLLFQPAEETGQGAQEMMNDPAFSEIIPDFIFALHNLPGFSLGEIIIKDDIFCAASQGMIVKLFGKTSHAAHPEKGLSPVLAFTEIIGKLLALNEKKEVYNDFVLLTIIHSRLGEVAFGTNPGYAEILATIRSYRDDDMQTIAQQAETIILTSAKKFGLKYNLNWTEQFDATINHPDAVKTVVESASKLKNNVSTSQIPFKWSEDFGAFLKSYKGALFGLGAGKNTTELHNPDYDFPDGLIEKGIMIFYEILRTLNLIE